jgi:formate dehydrogenase maturation protein FdhE
MVGITSEYDERLKSCPFCGEIACITLEEFNDGDIWFRPECSVCECGWQENYETKDEAIEAWNKGR